MKPLDSLGKRDLLAARKFDEDEVRAYADQFAHEARYGDAFDFYLKLGDKAAIRKIKEIVVKLGDTELLWRIEHYDPEAVTPDDWITCGDNAMDAGKFHSAAYAFEHVGDKERLARAEKEFKPPAEKP